MAKEKRYRNWASIAYPESMVSIDEWSEQIKGIRYIVSPLHDKDKTKEGELKKPHYHVIFIHEAPKSYEQIKQLCDQLKIARPEPVADTAAYARYLTHEDDKNKYHYDRKDIIAYGVDYEALIRTNADEEKAEIMFIKKVFEVIDKYKMQSISELFEYVITEEPENFKYLRQNAYLLTNVLKTKCASR